MPTLRAPPSQPKVLEETPALAPLNERIASLRAEIDAFIDEVAAAEAKQAPGVPVGVIRQTLTARGGACQCRQFLIHTGEIR